MRSAKARRVSPKAVEEKAARCSISTAGTTGGIKQEKVGRALGAKEAKVQEKDGKVQAKEKLPRSVSMATATIAVSGDIAVRSAGAHPQKEKAKAKERKARKAKVAEKDTKDGGARIAARTAIAPPRW